MTIASGVEERPTEFLFDVDLMGRMDDAGLFDAHGPHIELRRGRLVKMAPIGVEHSLSTPRVVRELWRVIDAVDDPELAVAQGTLILSSVEAPIPDAAVVRGKPLGRYFEASQALLIVEVSRSTLREDLTIKRDAYASAHIQEYWVVDPVGRTLHCFKQPEKGLYLYEQRFGSSDRVFPLFAHGAVDIAVADLF